MLKRFFAFYRPYRGLFILDFSCAVLSGLLELGFSSHDRYRATLHDVESRVLHQEEGLTLRVDENRIVVLFSIPSERIAPGDYSIVLEGETAGGGFEPLQSYVFRLIE